MFFVKNFSSLQLDIVGIVAVLGDGSVTKNAQASALSWHNLIPRLLPAPQALIPHDRDNRLPTQPGTVVGAYSGNVRHELNFFTSVVHPRRLQPFEVELVKIERKKDNLIKNAYGVSSHGVLAGLSMLGLAMSITLIVLSIHYEDGFALVATVLLSMCSTTVGFASQWSLRFKEPKLRDEREQAVPDGDVVIFYPPQGAFRIIQCDEQQSRLYFEAERCEYTFGDNAYRTLALFATVQLMFGVICLGNAKPKLQISFAASYMVLNALYWASSALDPLVYHWKHNYKVTRFIVRPPNGGRHSRTNTTDSQFEKEHPLLTSLRRRKATLYRKAYNFYERWLTWLAENSETPKQMFERNHPQVAPEARNFTSALWSAIALTGNIEWLNEATHIAPNNQAWREWIREAGEKATTHWDNAQKEQLLYGPTRVEHLTRVEDMQSGVFIKDEEEKLHDVILPPWSDYQKRLTELLIKHRPGSKRPVWPTTKQVLDLQAGEKSGVDVKDHA